MCVPKASSTRTIPQPCFAGARITNQIFPVIFVFTMPWHRGKSRKSTSLHQKASCGKYNVSIDDIDESHKVLDGIVNHRLDEWLITLVVNNQTVGKLRHAVDELLKRVIHTSSCVVVDDKRTLRYLLQLIEQSPLFNRPTLLNHKDIRNHLVDLAKSSLLDLPTRDSTDVNINANIDSSSTSHTLLSNETIDVTGTGGGSLINFSDRFKSLLADFQESLKHGSNRSTSRRASHPGPLAQLCILVSPLY